jgi:hypothetical protein
VQAAQLNHTNASEQVAMAMTMQAVNAQVKWLFDTEWEFVSALATHLQTMANNLNKYAGDPLANFSGNLNKVTPSNPPGYNPNPGAPKTPPTENAAGFHGYVKEPTFLTADKTMAEMGGEWVDVYPFGRPGFGQGRRSNVGSEGAGEGDVVVIITLDGEEIAAKIEKRSARQLHLGRKRL